MNDNEKIFIGFWNGKSNEWSISKVEDESHGVPVLITIDVFDIAKNKAESSAGSELKKVSKELRQFIKSVKRLKR